MCEQAGTFCNQRLAMSDTGAFQGEEVEVWSCLNDCSNEASLTLSIEQETQYFEFSSSKSDLNANFVHFQSFDIQVFVPAPPFDSMRTLKIEIF